MRDPYNLQRFVDAQTPVYQKVCEELRAGSKTTHWMWFVFPQIEGLGRSGMARMFAIVSMDEAQAYLEHTILGPRLRECTHTVNIIGGRTAHQIFGYPDELKFHSSMTLFAESSSDNAVFKEALRKYFRGELDSVTLEKL